MERESGIYGCGSAGILAGGDGSAKKKKGVINGAYGWGVYGIGETTVEYWELKKAEDVQILWIGLWNRPEATLGQNKRTS